MPSGARVGLSVGVLVLVSTANWQGTQPHSTRFTTALSIGFDVYLGRGWAETRVAAWPRTLCRLAVSIVRSVRCRSGLLLGCYWPLGCSK